MKGLDRSLRLARVLRRFMSVAVDRGPLGLLVSSSPSSSSSVRSTYAELLRRCGSSRALEDGRRVHAHLVAIGQSQDPFLSNLLVQMYGKCGSLGEARRVFDGIPASQRNVFSWGLMIAAYAQSGHYTEAIVLFRSMEQCAEKVVKPDCFVLASVLDACAGSGDLETGRKIHEKISTGCFSSNLVVETALLDMYAKCGRVEEARETFDRMQERDIVSWNAMLAAYAQAGHSTQALKLYQDMICEGIVPDEFTFSTIVSSCSRLKNLKIVHSAVAEIGLELDEAILCGLVTMYAKMGSIQESEAIFRRVVARENGRGSVAVWSSMIAAYAQLGDVAYAGKALNLYERMIVQPNNITFVSVFSACSSIGEPALAFGSKVHDKFLESQSKPDAEQQQPCSQWIVRNALITMYAKCRSFSRAKEAFDSIPDEKRGLVAWNAMLSAYAQLGSRKKLSDFFSAMGVRGLQPDEVTFTSILGGCARLGDLELGKIIHVQLKSTAPDLKSTVSVQVALLNMYARCADAAAMRQRYTKKTVPCGMPLVYWNALITSHGLYGHTPRILRLFRDMQLDGVVPDDVTFTSMLASCGRSGVTSWGRDVYQAMVADYGLRPSLAHYRCLIYVFGRGGHLGAAKELIESMEYEPGDGEWTTLLGFCRMHGGYRNVVLGREAAVQALEMNPCNETAYVLLLGINAGVHRLQDARVRWKKRVKENFKKPRALWRWAREPTWASLRQGHPHDKRTSQRRRHAFIEKLDWRASIKGHRRQQLQLSNKMPFKLLSRMHAFKDYLSPEAWTG